MGACANTHVDAIVVAAEAHFDATSSAAASSSSRPIRGRARTACLIALGGGLRKTGHQRVLMAFEDGGGARAELLEISKIAFNASCGSPAAALQLQQCFARPLNGSNAGMLGMSRRQHPAPTGGAPPP